MKKIFILILGGLFTSGYTFSQTADQEAIKPSLDEWKILIAYLAGSSVAGGKLKEAGLTHWPAPNKDASNSSGFTGLPGGNRARQSGDFYAMGEYGYLWTATLTYKDRDAYNFHLLPYSGAIGDAGSDGKANGFSIRCVKD